MSIFTGSSVALVTPFAKDGSIDYDMLNKIIEFQIANGTSAILINGTTGEPPTLSEQERLSLLKAAIKTVNHRVPVIAGTGSNCTAHAVQYSIAAQSLGADSVLAVTPYYNKCTQNGLIAHFKAIAESIDIPVIMYNVPTRTNVNIAPETMRKLSAVKNIAAVKEASGDIDQVQAVAMVAADTGLDMYTGDDSLTFISIMLGAKGLISVAANVFPDKMSKLCALSSAGKVAEARDLQFKLAQLMHALFIEVNPIPVKKAMQLIGFDCGTPRLPLTDLEPEHTAILQAAINQLKK